MAVPIFEDFLYPFLLQIRDKDVNTKEMKHALIDHFNLSEEDCALMTKSGSSSQVSDRINWVRQYLRRALFVDIPQRGVYRITERGKDYLNNHTDLRKQDLMAYPEFAAYAGGSATTKADTTTTTPVVETELTPTEMFEQAYHSIVDDLAADLLQKTLDQSPQIQQFAGALDEQKATKGVFITTSSYSKDARSYVDKLSKKIVLIDGQELARYMIEYNVGVSTKHVYEVKRIDSDYFEE